MIAHVAQRASGQNASTDAFVTVTLSSPTAIAVGNHLIARLSGAGGRIVTSVTDPRGNTWQIDRTEQSGTNVSISIVSSKVATAYQAGDTITFNLNAAGNTACVVDEFSGMGATAWVDQVIGGNSGGASTSTFASGAVTTTQNDEMTLGGVGVVGVDSVTPDADTPAWTALGSFSTTTTVRTTHGHYRIVSATETINYDGTIAVARFNAAAIVTYKAVTGSTGGPVEAVLLTRTAVGTAPSQITQKVNV